MSSKMDFADLLIETLKEHEKKLSLLIDRLEETLTSLDKAMQLYIMVLSHSQLKPETLEEVKKLG